MQPLKIRKDSWHYKLVARMGDLDDYNLDICEYTKALGKTLLIGVLTSVLTLLIVTPMVFLIGGFIFPWMLKSQWHEGGIIELMFITVGGLLIGVRTLYVKWKASRGPATPKEPNLLVEAFKSWKGKYCIPMVVVDEAGNKVERPIYNWDREE